MTTIQKTNSEYKIHLKKQWKAKHQRQLTTAQKKVLTFVEQRPRFFMWEAVEQLNMDVYRIYLVLGHLKKKGAIINVKFPI